MADQFKTTNKTPAGPGSATGIDRAQQSQAAPKLSDVANQAATAGREVKDKAMSTGHDLKEKVSGLASQSAEMVKEQASELADVAKDFVSHAGETIKQRAYEQKGAGAEYVGSIADTMRRAAREFDQDLPIAGTYIRKAADRVEEVADSVRDGDIQDLLRGAQSFARRQPTAFLGLAVLAGFGAVRFLKSSAGTTSQSSAPSTGASQVRRAGHIDARPASERQVASQMPSDSAFPGAQR